MTSSSNAPTTSLDVRARLVDALRLDLVGPRAGHALAEERLPARERPSKWYLTGFLIPSNTPPEAAADEDEDDDPGEVPETSGLAEESAEEQRAAKRAYFPSSMGLSFLVGAEAEGLEVVVRWGDYAPAQIEWQVGDLDPIWQRNPREESATVALGRADGVGAGRACDVPDSLGLQLHVLQRPVELEGFEEHLPAGTRSVSVFLVNHRPAIVADDGERSSRADEAYAFQAEIEVRCASPFVARPDLHGVATSEWDEQVSDLHYADTPEYATGHGISAEWEVVDGACHVLRTAWIPSAEVEKTETVPLEGVELRMETLGSLDDGAAVEAALSPLVRQYREWIAAQRAKSDALTGQRRDTATELLRRAGLAADRIERGIAVLAADAEALDAFRVANRAVARALRRRLGGVEPRWRAFQLAFLLVNLPGLVDETDPHRETADLLFFPTGGGKTEAYLGLAALAMVLRRLRHPGDNGRAGGGVSVMMRYTLRLLTFDQLGRAAALVCALELEREADPDRYGRWPFEIGLWVGKAATPNVMGRKGDGRDDTARTRVRQYKNDSQRYPVPIPLEICPWCGQGFRPASFLLLPNDDQPTELRIGCANADCEFGGDRQLPIVPVDDMLYRRLPAFLISTVDKFATLPWVGPCGALLGRADRFDPSGYYGAAEPNRGQPLAAPLPPPDLIIQDELHLISGPLGTMAGLYETAIDALSTRMVDGRPVRPKVVASTATVRQAKDQIQALFARPQTEVFPPPGPDRRDSFFAHTVPAAETPARMYLGISAPGRNPKVVMRRAWLALMGAAEQAFHDAGGTKRSDNPADPYMTVLGYFNSLRELGGARRILEEEVRNTVKAYGARKRLDETVGLFRDRTRFADVLELTSRVPTGKVAEARRQLEMPFGDGQRSVDCAIATNMISVGLDIPRLGLMVVVGQPKSHAEYIQATSRVGRRDAWPGLVVTLLNTNKPRDRSHYERFRHYHETFYRTVEVASVTPFAARALDRGFAGMLVALARHLEPKLTPARGAEALSGVRVALETRLKAIVARRLDQQDIPAAAELQAAKRGAQNRVVDLLDAWVTVVQKQHDVGGALQYQQYETAHGRPLLRDPLDNTAETAAERKFRANRSLRDVEPDVNLYLRRLGQEGQ